MNYARSTGSALLLASLICATAQFPASADALLQSPKDAAASARWVNPQLRQNEADSNLKVELTEVPSAINLGDNLVVAMKVTNNGRESLKVSDLAITPQHADAETSATRVRKVLASDPSAFPYAATADVAGTGGADGSQALDPGQTVELSVSVPTAVGEAGSFGLEGAGFYPVLIGVSDGVNYASNRFLLSVVDTKSTDDSATNTQDAAREATSNTPQATPLSILYPLSAEVDIVAGETGDAPQRSPLILSSEQLASQLAAGGRIDSLVDAYKENTAKNPQLAQATCLALDPQLIDALSRMADGYSVSSERPSSVSQKRRLRDSWGSTDETIDSTPGTGQADAQRILDELKDITANSCTVALPWANAEVNAIAATNNQWLIQEALLRGQSTIEDVLGVVPLENVVIAPTGYVTEHSVQSLGWADSSRLAQTGGTDGQKVSIDQLWAVDAQSDQQATQNQSGSAVTATQSPDASDSASAASATSQAPTPLSPVRVLVSDNSVWSAPATARFSQLATGITGVSYQGSLAATLAESGSDPDMVSYGSYDTRMDPDLDSAASRNATANSTLRQAVSSPQRTGDDQAPEPVLAMLPASMTSGSEILNTAASLLDSRSATPMKLEDYLTPSQGQSTELQQLSESEQATLGGSAPDSDRFGAPFDDPTVVSDAEIQRARQQSGYIDDLTDLMVNDPQVALTPYHFTQPLRQDLLRALRYTGRNSIADYDSRTQQANTTLNLNRDTLTELRGSVSLLPPGNVYTRISDSSPLLIVAQNGLPLPVDARIRYVGPENASIDAPSPLIIPAKGSITISMTANLPTDSGRTDLSLWLATPQNAAISDPVEIGVQTRSGVFGASGTAALVVIGLLGLMLGRMFLKRRRDRLRQEAREKRREQRLAAQSVKRIRRTPPAPPRGQQRQFRRRERPDDDDDDDSDKPS